MSDASEVKRYIPDSTPMFLAGESTPEPTTCVILGRDHDRIVAEKDAEIARLKESLEWETTLKRAFLDRHKEQTLKVARQAKVIEKLKLAVTDIANKNTCWRLYEIDKYKSYEDAWEGVAEFAGKVLNELEAIEQGEGT